MHEQRRNALFSIRTNVEDLKGRWTSESLKGHRQPSASKHTMVAWTPGVSDAQLPVYEALEPLWQHISQAPNSSVSSLRRANRTCSKRVDQLVDSLSLDCEAKGGHGELLLCCASAIWKNLQHLKLRARYHEGAELAAKAATLLPGLRRMELTLLHDEAQEVGWCCAPSQPSLCCWRHCATLFYASPSMQAAFPADAHPQHSQPCAVSQLSSCLALVSLDLSACWLPSHTLLQLFTLTRLQHLDLSGQHLLTSLAFARHMTGLHALILQGCSGGCTLDLRPLANCSALTSLDLRGSHPRCLEDVPEATLAALQAAASPLPDDQPARPPPAQLSNSEGATDSAATALFTDLPQAPAMSFEPGSLAALAHCPQLQNLRLARCFLTPSLAPLAACTQLRTLDLQMCTALTDLSPLSALPSLTDLDLYGCTELTSIQPLALSAPSLTRLMMAFCHSVPDLSVLSGATRLQQLDVSCCIGVRSLPLQACRNLTHLQMKQLKVCTHA